MKAKITKRLLESTLPVEGNTTIYDSDIRGLHVRLYPSGRASYHLYYRTNERQERRPKLGNYPAMPPEQARQIAAKLLMMAMSGEDPANDRSSRNGNALISDISQSYISRRQFGQVKPRTLENYEWLIRSYIKPKLGKTPAVACQRDDVMSFHRQMHDRPRAANQALSLLKSIFQEAIDYGDIPNIPNPCTRIKPFANRKVERFLNEQETINLNQSLEYFHKAELAPPQAILAIRLLYLTGCRRNEILHLTWSEVVLEKQCLNLADSKTGSRRVPLSQAACSLLRAHKSKNSYTPDGLVICGMVKGKPFQGLQKIWSRVRKHAGIEDVRLHDLRHNLASQLISAGHDLTVIARILGHKDISTTQRYAHLADSSVLTALEDFENRTIR